MKWMLVCLCMVSLQCPHGGDPVDPSDYDRGLFELTMRYDSIRSYPGGGGLFVGIMKPGFGFGGSVRLRLEADPLLGATLPKSVLGLCDTVFEVCLRPAASLSESTQNLTLVAEHGGKEKCIPLRVHIFSWEGPAPDAAEKRDAFKDWFASRHPELSAAFNPAQFVYATYPEILIVEHSTFLTPSHEVRICVHVMAPPDDWIKIRIRPRNRSLPAFAAHRASDGTITEIPASEYPELCGY